MNEEEYKEAINRVRSDLENIQNMTDEEKLESAMVNFKNLCKVLFRDGCFEEDEMELMCIEAGNASTLFHEVQASGFIVGWAHAKVAAYQRREDFKRWVNVIEHEIIEGRKG